MNQTMSVIISWLGQTIYAFIKMNEINLIITWYFQEVFKTFQIIIVFIVQGHMIAYDLLHPLLLGIVVSLAIQPHLLILKCVFIFLH